MKFRFNEEQLNGGYLAYDGTFLVRVVKAEYKTSEAGNQVLNLEFAGLADQAGKKGYELITITDKMSWKIANLLQALGFSKGVLIEGIDLTHETVAGRVCKLIRKSTGTRTYNGKERTQWDAKFFPASPEELETVGGHQSGESSAPDFGSEDIPF